MNPLFGRFSAGATAAGVALILLGGCTRPDGPEVFATCKPRAVIHLADTGTLSVALARQAEENRSYRDCLERRGVRVAP